MKDGKPFAFAGLWERWEPKGAEAVDSCTIIVTTANDLVSQIHDRMPVILAPQDYDLWLDPEVHEPDKLTPLLKRYPENEMEAYPIGFGINSPKNEGAGLIQPL
jgi:putative SOS response-associated peptidase YedK